VAGCTGKAVGVWVGGNQMMVAVGVALAGAVGVRVGVSTGPEQAASINPQAANRRDALPHFCLHPFFGCTWKWRRCPVGRRGFLIKVSFIVLNTGRNFT